MTDVLIRDVPPENLRRLDEMAAERGLTRNEFLRRHLVTLGWTKGRVSMEDLERSMDAMADLGDEEIMRQAWS